MIDQDFRSAAIERLAAINHNAEDNPWEDNTDVESYAKPLAMGQMYRVDPTAKQPRPALRIVLARHATMNSSVITRETHSIKCTPN